MGNKAGKKREIAKSLRSDKSMPFVTSEGPRPKVDLPETLKLCANRRCCGSFAFYATNGDDKLLMPLKKVDVKSELCGGLAVTNVELTYVNPSSEQPPRVHLLVPSRRDSCALQV